MGSTFLFFVIKSIFQASLMDEKNG